MPDETKNPMHSVERVVDAAKDAMGSLRAGEAAGDENEAADTVIAERAGRTNSARGAAEGHGREPGPWDSIGENSEGLDDLQGHFATDASPRIHLAALDAESPPFTSGPPAHPGIPITPALWDRLAALSGRTLETPKGEPFAVNDMKRGVGVTVSPLDGGREWTVSAQELETAWTMVRDGEPLDGLASMRLHEKGLRSAHPEYVAGLLRAVLGEEEA